MSDPYARLGVRRRINAAGALTRLGGAVMATEVVEAMAAASRASVDIGELQDAASARIAEATGAEAGLVTTGAAAALTLAAAASIARWDVAKMAAGTPLTDADREPWLRLICQRIDLTEGNQVITCSALRRSYRDILKTAEARVRFLHLSGSAELLAARIGARTDHFMPPKLLTSQLDALEPLTPDEDGVVVDVEGTPADIVARALQALDLHKPSAFHQ